MLTIYRDVSEIPEGIRYVESNDIYFNGHTNLDSTDKSEWVINSIEGAEYQSKFTFIGRNKDIGGLYIDNLSTGSKTILNILSHNDVCFNVVECGINAIHLLPEISCFTDGHILWKHCNIFYHDNFDCDFYYNGIRFLKVFDFFDYLNKDDDNEELLDEFDNYRE